MSFHEARQYVGLECMVAWRDRRGEVQERKLFIVDVSFVPLYGICLITDYMEIRLDRVVSIRPAEEGALPAAA
ncbi:MAG: hypothetical protein NZ550_00705 [Fimbriimonadales bacterium]|nr:hypothetical protein [Fimbriimonadales bacterium]MDW8052654.1 hypothetical protein [Armatimonadota bacterium]